MAIVATDIKLYQSTNGLGGAITATEIVDNTLNNLLDNVTGAEAAAGDTEYRAFYVKNTHLTLTWQSVLIWIGSNTTSAYDTLNIGLDAAGVIATGSGSSIVDESTAPLPAVTFSDTATVGLSIGNIPPGSYILIWVKRIVNAGAAAITPNAATINWTGDTDA